MMPKSPNNPLRTVYCPHCHLATRANSVRCLHCGKPASRQDQTQRRTAGPRLPQAVEANEAGKASPRYLFLVEKIDAGLSADQTA